MLDKQQYIISALKQIPFLLVFCAMLFQPITETFSLFSESSIEFADHDVEDDTEKEAEDTKEKDKKIEPQLMDVTIAYCDLYNNNTNHYLQLSRWSCNLEILIPPPRQA